MICLNDLLESSLELIIKDVCNKWRATTKRRYKPKFPTKKSENFAYIKEEAAANRLPKVYKSNLGIYVITDYEIMKDAFNKVELSSRFVNKKLVQASLIMRAQQGLAAVAKAILGENCPFFKNGDTGTEGSEQMEEMLSINADDLCSAILAQSGEGNGKAFDPRVLFMNATLNSLTEVALGKRLDINDPEFESLADNIKTILGNVQHRVLTKVIHYILPMSILKLPFMSRLIDWINPGEKRFNDALVKGLLPYILQQIQIHKESFMPGQARNFIDSMIESSQNRSEMNFYSASMSVVSLYVASSDSVTVTLCWLLLTLSKRPELQAIIRDEINTSIAKYGRIVRGSCHQTRAILLENQRHRVVTDSLPHMAKETITLDNVTIPKGALVLGSLTAVMHSGKNFKSPEVFDHTRHLDDNGRFVHNPKICAFGIGNRNCVGLRLARDEYFTFASQIVRKFEIAPGSEVEPSPKTWGQLLSPDNVQLKFTPIDC
ncbi:Oidioi.mRNA.OKI2018_I69.chr2.g6409.t1.cds [Oikopleura dioica]|uniref:Oidioi.mRNA.OKI2018_I69.chr2.g6409.t1.cds n=1 Tax=Oikopleura dioica TaxID=34765 RepID=A0ABN7T3K6_OIKDI|nr:Oidioi.mRNA.OKI2018_I69.chr2.g6409.t1.cds [Oikopleura dioica]